MNLKQDFQNEIAELLFVANMIEEKACFRRRFDPNNDPTNRVSTNKEIANLMKNDLPVYCEEKINQTIRKVIEVLHKAYEEEMKADGVNTEALLNLKPGGTLKGKANDELGETDKHSHKKFSPWKVVHRWLWKDKFNRWIDKNAWPILKERAKTAPTWLQFLTHEEMAPLQMGTRGLILPPPPPSVQKITPTIPANQSLWVVIDLELQNFQLLLLHRSQQGQALICPSSAYAPISIMEKPPIVLPQKDSWADKDEEKRNFMFGEAGKEEFLAIALEKHLNLPWLTPREDEELLEWNAERIKQLFDQLEQQGNWQVFYQSFEVVESV